MYLLAKKLGFADLIFKNIKVTNNLPSAEDVLREINRGGFSSVVGAPPGAHAPPGQV